MNAKELMIGDWVSCFDSYYQVESIETIHPDASVGLKGYGCELAEQCEPIPLTAEILEKNGWWYDIEDMWQHDEVNFCIEKWNGRFQCYDINQIKLYSVHELQHALRLCGLNDLADNFKV